MLVLSRKKNESIVINNDITVTVVEIRGDKVRLGIVAPKEVPVHRQEVFDAIHGKPGAEPAPPTVAGSYEVVATFAGSVNYKAFNTALNFTIKKASPTVTLGGWSGAYRC